VSETPKKGKTTESVPASKITLARTFQTRVEDVWDL